jgi:FkbM family methyltransferase
MGNFSRRLRSAIIALGYNDTKSNIAALYAHLCDRFIPAYTVRKDKHKYVFYVSSRCSLGRAVSLFTKEPDTIEWINSFAGDDVFYDIGANIGAFTVYAAVRNNKAKVYAFEPAFHNYYLLNRNMILNRLDNARAFNIAFTNACKMDLIYMKTTVDGGAGVNVGESVDCNKVKFIPEYVQPIVCYTLDGFIQQHKLDFPNHIKIDVDGLEPEIIEGSVKTIGDKRLMSLLVEVNEADDKSMEMVEKIKSSGFKIRKSKLSCYQTGTFINYIFVR